MQNIYDVVLEYLNNGKTGILTTVIRKEGSAPREEGAKMFVGEDGKSFGTIGGGRVEAEVCAEAIKDMGTRNAKLFHYRMDALSIAANGMVCGGNVDVFLEPVMEAHREVYEGIRNCENCGRRAVLITRFGKNYIHKTLVDAHGETWGYKKDLDHLQDKLHILDEREVRLLSEGVLLEPLNINSFVYIFGAGHVSQYVAKVAKIVDFNVVVIDDRNDFVKVFDHLDFTGNEFVVIVTRGHSHDAAVLEEAVKKNTRYIGMIGSRRKNKIIFEHLLEKGVSQETIDAVHAPIGIDIHSETPQEIAISIVAELIKVRRAKTASKPQCAS